MLNFDKEVAALERMTVDQLRAKFAEVFGEQTNGRHKRWLIKRIIWRMQANAEGDLSGRARRRAAELANDADLRVTAPRQSRLSAGAEARTTTVATNVRPGTGLLPGTVLTRQYKGRTVRTTVLADGFEYEGERYKSLRPSPRAVTGQHWNAACSWAPRQGRQGVSRKHTTPPPKTVRCAVYTRKSTEEARAGVQHARCPAGRGRGIHQEPAARGLGLSGRPL
ncbi:MAG: DUF2924 domain-containing protein [Pirellulales bacterium]